MTRHWLAGLLLCWAGAASAESLPRWELGMGMGGMRMPDYRGSDESRNYFLPFPYVAYRLDWLKADRNGVRAVLFDVTEAELNISLGASPPVRSKSNRAREGMPDIKPMLELGPSLDFNLWRSTADRVRLDLRLPARAAITARINPEWAGWVFTPRLNVDFAGLGGNDVRSGWNLGLLAGPMFADRRQNAYFYSVASEYARAGRSAYEARAGYAGMQYLASLSRRFGDAWVGAYARYDDLRGAVFEDSPLVRRKSYVTAGFGITWTFARATEMVEVKE
ncbi:MAG: hypothetical protein CGU28_11550 [Candidatus Dactylopiibacterium carminicum]|nr:MAG: hypothetical protein CGU28_11550 [Candidatus Dactylopiibacterium carminicum]